MSRIVVALGGNALLRRGERLDLETQQRNAAVAAAALAPLAARNELVLTHGNGPQVGLLALETDEAHTLDVLVAESQGLIGYLVAQELARVSTRRVAALLTQVVVDPGGPAFAWPSKPIGPVYDEQTAERLAGERGWAIAPDGDWFRRVVPSPEPLEVVELAAIEALLAAGAVVVCGGGGGIPVARTVRGVRGVEAVVDKDRTAALIAERLHADRLVVLTDVPHVVAGWRTSAARPIGRIEAADLAAMSFEAGSMGPKVEAVCRFVERTGGSAAIGALDDLAAVVAGTAGTQVRRGVLEERASGEEAIGTLEASGAEATPSGMTRLKTSRL